MIPAVIHYCWFGHKEKPSLVKKCINSWHEFCPNFEIIEWNEENFDIGQSNKYVQQAYAHKKYAFVSDYVRLRIIAENGGVYLDTDVELIRPIDDLLRFKSFFSAESNDGDTIATGLGFGAELHHPYIEMMLKDYDNIPFVLDDGQLDLVPCPIRNTSSIRSVLCKKIVSTEIIIDGNLFLPREYFNPLDYISQEMKYKSENTYAIHWGASSWFNEEQRLSVKRQRRFLKLSKILKKVFRQNFWDFMKKVLFLS